MINRSLFIPESFWMKEYRRAASLTKNRWWRRRRNRRLLQNVLFIFICKTLDIHPLSLFFRPTNIRTLSGMCSVEGEKKKKGKKKNYFNIQCAKTNRTIIICTLLNDKTIHRRDVCQSDYIYYGFGRDSTKTLR